MVMWAAKPRYITPFRRCTSTKSMANEYGMRYHEYRLSNICCCCFSLRERTCLPIVLRRTAVTAPVQNTACRPLSYVDSFSFCLCCAAVRFADSHQGEASESSESPTVGSSREQRAGYVAPSMAYSKIEDVLPLQGDPEDLSSS